LDPSLAAYITITALLVVTPGASTAVVVRNVLDGGRSAGMAAATGVAAGNTAWAAAAGLGITTLIARVPIVFAAVRLIGAGYLAFLALRAYMSVWTGAHAALPSGASTDSGGNDRRSGFREGVAVNLLNPSVATFYMVVVPSFLPAPGPSGRFVVLASIHVAMAFLCHTVWVSGLNVLRAVWSRPAARRTLEAITGTALLALAVRMLQ
jgi:threonine/homoserine/homoserine lactone efflux protein